MSAKNRGKVESSREERSGQEGAQAGQDAGKLTGQRGAPSDFRKAHEGLTLAALSLAASRHGEVKQCQSGKISRWSLELQLRLLKKKIIGSVDQ